MNTSSITDAVRKHVNLVRGGESGGVMPGNAPPAGVRAGTSIEKEHTKDKDVARKIAADHLAEHRRYYDKRVGLPAMEKNLERIEQMEKRSYVTGFMDELAKISEAQIYRVGSRTKSPLNVENKFETFRKQWKNRKAADNSRSDLGWFGVPSRPRREQPSEVRGER